MILNNIYAPIINELIEELSQQGFNRLSELLSTFFNELMKLE